MKLIDAVLAQPLHLLDGPIRGDHAAGLGIVIQTIEPAAQPIGNRGAAA